MNLLPKTHKNFSQKEYWESFFKKRGNKAFEWYGEYLELCSYIHGKINKNDDILMVGCGNSTLSMDMYDSGYTKITNIDISNNAIKQQEKKNKKRPEMKYLVMDALDMKFEDDSFSVVFDKGTLDALMSDDSTESLERANKLFNQIVRVTNENGKYICISLLQEHILKNLLTYFTECKWSIKIERCMEAEQKTSENGEMAMPVFVITCTKKKKSVLEFCMSDNVKKYSKIDDIISLISSMQQSSQIINSLNRTNLSDQEEIFFELYKPGDETNPRYTIYILDKPYRTKKDGEYAAFIVPQGREVEWLFSTKEGRRKFLDYGGNARLAIVILNRGQTFQDLDQIKSELNDHIKNFAPAGLKSRINYLSYGNDIGKREVKVKGNSDISGPFIVEDLVGENEEMYRRLIFLNNQNIIQSEAKLKYSKGRRGKQKLVVDPTYVSCTHHAYMTIGVHTVCPTDEGDVILIGLGGGSLCHLLQIFLPQTKVTAIDIDPAILKIATEWFGLQENDNMIVKIEDGLKYIDNTMKTGSKCKAILFDVDSKDSSVGMSCPPKPFLENDVLENVLKLIGDDGVFILNLVLRNDNLYEGITKNLKSKFKSVISYKLSEDLNEIFYCYPYEVDKKEYYAKLIGAFVKIAQLEKQNRIQKLELDLKETWEKIKFH